MSHPQAIRRGKRSLSAHQKQMRFFTGLSLFLCFLVTVVLFWLLNQPSYAMH
jgi:hypothetical protein